MHIIFRALGIAYCISRGYIVQAILPSLGQKMRKSKCKLGFHWTGQQSSEDVEVQIRVSWFSKDIGLHLDYNDSSSSSWFVIIKC